MATFGETATGSLGLNCEDIQRGSVFAGFAGKALSISVLRNVYPGTKSKCAIYEGYAVGDVTGPLIASTEEIIDTTGIGNAAWITYNFTTPITLQDKNYLLVYWQNDLDMGYGIYYTALNSGQSIGRTHVAAYTGQFQNLWGDTSYNYTRFCIYCTYDRNLDSTRSLAATIASSARTLDSARAISI